MHETQPHPRTGTDPSTLSPLKRAFLALEQAQQKITALEQGEREPIAVIGLGCRVPGAENPAAFWQLLRDGVDAVSKIPTDRFDVDALYDPDPDAPGRIATKWGGFVRNVDQFDSAFFGISPREARGMDPQQRLMLEVSWEALEHAGQAPLRLEHSKTGVYFGVCSNDYSNLQIASGDRALLDSHYGSGIAHSVVSGRLSYLLGLQGPSVSVDTACSSSLVALHLACQALRQGDCQMALAGGVNLILGPELFVGLSHARFLAPDGRCKTFSAAADGFGRGEGCGVIVLKRLRDAKEAGDRILAVIRASAVNQDGPSSSLSAPNGPAQQALIRSALKSAGLQPRDVGVIEAHGTGTRLGDPLEVQALGAVFGRDRDPANPLFIGSVKTNVGHLEAAAGVTGLIKLILALRHREIPPHLHFTSPSPFIDWADLPIRIPTAVTPWAPISGRRIGGVSSFGFSGTNVHVLVEEAPAEPDLPPRLQRAHLFTVSARDDGALSELAAGYASAVAQHTDRALPDLCHTANVGRSQFAVRATVMARTISELSTRLTALSCDDEASGLRKATVVRRDPPRVAFLFSGQGSQYVGMARGLYDGAPVFRQAFDRCAAALDRHLTQPLAEVVFDGTAGATLDSTAYTQPALFAVEYALTELWRSFGVIPAIVAGHSVGELVAATVAGVFGLEDALHLVARRGALMASLPAGGAMAAIATSEADILESIAPLRAELSIAAVNAPTQVVISGSAAAVEAVTAGFAARGIRCQRLPVSHAFHSPLMEPVLDAFEHELQALKMAAPRIHLISNLTGQLADPTEVTDPRYWRRHLRNPVRFADCLNAMAPLLPDCVIEIGPQQTLLALCKVSDEVLRFASLRKGRDDWQQVLEGVGSLFLRGCNIDWRGADNGERCRVVDLPTYPFQRQRHWLKMQPQAETNVGSRADLRALQADVHPLLGCRLPSPLPQAQFEARLSASTPAFIGDHRIDGAVLLPGTASVEMARAAGAAVFGGSPSIEDLVLREAMVFSADGSRVVQTIIDPLANGSASFQIQSRPEHADGPWILHFQGALRPQPNAASQVDTPKDIDQIAARCTIGVPVGELYALLKRQGIAFGPRFRVLRDVKRGTREALSRIEIPEEVRSDIGAYGLHPVLLDGCLQTVVACLYPDVDPASLYLPVGVRNLRVWSPLGDGGICHAVLQEAGPSAGAAAVITARIRLYNPDGRLAVEFDGLEFQRLAVSTRRRLAGHGKGAFFERVFELKPAAPAMAASARHACWVVIGERNGAGGAMLAALEARGERCLLAEASGRARSGPAGQSRESAAALSRMWCDRLGGLTGVIDLRWLDWPADADQCCSQIGTVLRDHVTETLSLVEALSSNAFEPSPRLWLVTRGAQPAGEGGLPLSPWPSAAWGLSWSVALERPQLRTVSIDLDPAADADEIPALLAEIDQDGSESQVAIRAGQRWVARLQRLESHSRLGAAGMAIPAGETYRLVSPRQGSLDELCLAPADRRAPEPGEVEIEVEATGLNFRDVLDVLGLYPGESGPLGGECAGMVVRLGSGVHGLREGDRVIAMAAGSFARHVVARQELVRPLPDGVTITEGAAIPIAYLTAGYALQELAQITSSDRVLIHAAAGGVGLAAVHIALRAGAEIFATAGSLTKRARLRAMGVRHVLDSRSPSFADEILALTAGEGVNVVLNSLSGPMIEATFRATAHGARFVEIGKRGVWTRAQVSRLGREIAYHLVDLGDVAKQQPALIGDLFTRLVADISNGALPTPSLTVFPLEAAAAAFRHMMQARQIGKIALVHKKPVLTPPPLVRPDGTYLVTGGNSGLGLFAAEWLVERGARHLVLVGRRGATAESSAAIARMTAAGAKVATASVDVGDATALNELLERSRGAGPPLRGILHAAGVIDDAELGAQDWSRFERVLRPKAIGVLNLDRLTRRDHLDWFVLFSSAASVLGSPGQANYAAANTVLDLVAHERRRLGLAALSVNWGPWSEIGLAAGAFTTERLAASGLSPMAPQQAVSALEEAMSSAAIQIAIVDADWPQLIKKREATGVSPCYFAKLADAAGVRRQAARGTAQRQSATIRERLAAAAPKRRPLLLRDFVRSTTVAVLGWDESRTLDDNAPLSEAGLDSLLSVELRNVLSRSLGLSLPATLLFDHPTIASLERHLSNELRDPGDDGKSETVRTEAPKQPRGSAVLAEIAELSDEEVERLVAGKQR